MLKEFKKRLKILKINFNNLAKQDSSYSNDVVGVLINAIGSGIYTILVVNLIATRYDHLGPLPVKALLFVYMMHALLFYICEFLFDQTHFFLLENSQKGYVDYSLLRPTSSRFILRLPRNSVLRLVVRLIPLFAIMIPVVEWSMLPSFTFTSLIAAIIIFALGTACVGMWGFWMTLPGMVNGFTREPLFLIHHALHRDQHWFLMPGWFRATFSTFFPTILPVGLGCAVLFGYYSIPYGLLISISAYLVYTLITNRFYKYTINRYGGYGG